MRKEVLALLTVIFIGAIALVAARLLVGGGEDTWICVNNQWVKHGNPRAPAPQSGCGDEAKKTVDQRLRTLKSHLHAIDSGAEARNLFPDLSMVYVDNGHGNPQIPAHILPFTYYYSQEANITVAICNINQTVFICLGKLERLIQPKDYPNCQVTKEYLQIER